MKVLKYACCLLFVLTISLQTAVAGGKSDVDNLVDLLTQKGTITKEDAAGLKAEIAAKKEKENQDFTILAGRQIKITGYNQVLYKQDQAAGGIDGFSIRRARLELKGDITEQFEYDLQADFAGASAKLLDSIIGYKLRPELKLTIGQFKVPFSQENLSSDVRPDTINRSQVVEALVARTKDVIGNQNGRDIGFQAGGKLFSKGSYSILEYAAGVFNGSGINTTDMNEQKDLAERVVVRPLKTLSVGGSFYQGSYYVSAAQTAADRKRAGGEFDYEQGLLSVKGEYIAGTDAKIEKQGWYAFGGYYILPGKLQAVLKYDIFDPNKNASNDETSVYTYGINFYPAKLMLVQVNYEHKLDKPVETNNDCLSGQFTLAF